MPGLSVAVTIPRSRQSGFHGSSDRPCKSPSFRQCSLHDLDILGAEHPTFVHKLASQLSLGMRRIGARLNVVSLARRDFPSFGVQNEEAMRLTLKIIS